MNSFWINLYDRAKDRRYGAFFFGALAASGVLAGLGTVLYQVICAVDRRYLIPVSAGFGLLFIGWVVRGIFLMRKRSRERLRFPPLSRDERRKARLKLLKGVKPIKYNARPPAPDSYVKY